jgi:Zn-dependent peptidase ImmA (M78 family)
MNKIDLWLKALSLRKELGENATSPIDILSLAYGIERLSIVYYPMGLNMSGICIKGGDNNVIAVNSSMTLGRQRFSMAHELFHLYFDDNELTAVCTIKIGEGNEKERQADQFAAYLLMPPEALSDMLMGLKKSGVGQLSIHDVVRLEQRFGVSRQAMLYRLIGENVLTRQEAEAMRQNVISSAVNLGYDDTLYRPTSENKQYKTFGHYIRQTDKALERGLISKGKYEELLLAAFRSDLVYDEENKGGGLLD